MGDYILEILQMQEEPFPHQSPEKIREVLAWQAAEEYVVGVTDLAVDEPSEEDGVLPEKAVREMNAGKTSDVEEDKTEVLRNILEKMEQVEFGTGIPERQEVGQSRGKENNGETAAEWSESIRSQQQWGLGPEALSMFFQRDARRYS